MTAKKLLEFVMAYKGESINPVIPGLSIQIYEACPFPRFAISLARDPEAFSVTFSQPRESVEALQVDIYYQERGLHSERPDWKRSGELNDWKFDEDVTILPKRFPGWNLEKLTDILHRYNLNEEDGIK